MPCPSCGETNRAGRRFCARCGAGLPATCAACGATNESGAQFCGQCGAALAAGSPSAEAAAMPATLAGGRYHVRRLLGEGGKKRVYLATDTRLDRDVAIALVKTEGLDETGMARVRREARAMGRLGDHPHIVTVFDVGEENGQPYIVSQYMPGGSVDDLLQAAEHHRLPLADTLRLAGEICRGLQHAHDSGVVHRDLKPSNVWLTADGTVKLGDFGLAVVRDRSRLTVEGMMVGTVAYMPPEQALGKPTDARSDLYALGATLYEMLTGRPPFLGDDAVAVVSQHIHTAPVAPSWHNGEVPRVLESLVLSLLAKVPEERPASAGAVRDALAAVASAPAVSETRTTAETNPLDRLAGGVFVGRERELGELRTCVDDARAGRGRLVLIAGEPGIGKTRIASEMTTYAQMRGFQALWGRCHETGGAPAYWPWVQIIRAYLHDRDPTKVLSEMGTGAADIAQLVSEIRERAPSLPQPPALEPEQARFRLFDSITSFVRTATSRQPLVLVLDDVQWADQASLLLLQFLAREMGTARLLVLVTYRDLELDRDHPLFQALGEITREPGTSRVQLRGLTETDVARYIEMTADFAPPADLVAAVHHETEGNPFFTGEVVRLLAAEGRLVGERPAGWKVGVPQGVREVIGRRLSRLSTDCNRILTLASVVGREFGIDVLERVSGVGGDEVLEVLDEALAARIVAKVPEAIGRYRFAHALVRDTLYEESSPVRRIRLHRQIGEALEALHEASLHRHLPELAYHFVQAAEDGRLADKAILYSRRAAERALQQLAYEDGARQYELALHTLATHRPTDETQRCEVLLGLGEARRRTGDVDKAKESFREAAEVARRLGAAEVLARAALAYGGPGFVFGLHDEFEVGLLEQALEALGEHDGALRASVLARLAMSLYGSGARERCTSLSAEAVEMARRVRDAATLATALYARHIVLWGPRQLGERLEIASEIVRLAEAAGDKEQAARGRHFRIVDLLEVGDMRAAYREMEIQSRLADELRQPLYQWHRLMYAAMRAIMEGRMEEGENLANEALGVGQRASQDAMETWGLHIYSLRRDCGRIVELEGSVAAFAEQQPEVVGWHNALAFIYLETGRIEEARREFEIVAQAGFANVTEDSVWLQTMAISAEIAAALGDVARAAELYDLMLPYAGRNVVVGAGVVCSGAFSHYLGILAATMSRWVEGMLHFESALDMNARMNARPRLAGTQIAYGAMLLARGEAGDAEKALGLLARAVDAAQELGLNSLIDKGIALKLRAQGVDTVELHTSIDAVAVSVQQERPDLRAEAAPDGTVTILFSDIEGFTAMTERLGDLGAQEILRAHGNIVREQVAAHGGLEVKSQGDGFMVVFSSARRAIFCAIAVQEALAAYSAEHPERSIRVRIGLHTGEVIRESDDFFGKNVILAARISEKARGGEILVSGVLRELTESVGDIRFGDGRPVDLKGISGVRHVHEVLWTGAPAAEPSRATVARENGEGAGNVFRSEGEYWTLSYAGTVCRVRDTKGLHHIAQLLRHPGEQFHVRQLAGEAEATTPRRASAEVAADGLVIGDLGDAGPLIDARARADYKRRLEELREELAEAEEFNDPGRVAAAREQMEFLASQLASAVGLGGRERKAASSAERARLTVTKRIKDALGKIRDSHPALGQFLAARVKTGYLCSYSPDPERSISWEL